MEENKQKPIKMYCLKCKKKVIVVPELIKKETKKGDKYMFVSNCPNCDTKMCKMTKKPDSEIKTETKSDNIKELNPDNIQRIENNIKKIITDKERYKEFEKNEPQKNNI